VNAPLSWLQLRHNPTRLAVALAGIAFAVLLVMMQLGFRAALFESSVRFHERFDYDIALFSKDSIFIVRPEPFSIRRLYQARAIEEVTKVSPVYIAPGIWKNPWNFEQRAITLLGVHPEDEVLHAPGFIENCHKLKHQDALLFDSQSRPEFGPVAETVRSEGTVHAELQKRAIEVVGLFEMGPSFGIDGIAFAGEDTWLRLFPDRSRNDIQLGLIKLKPGADPDAVREKIEKLLPTDVLVMTKAEFIAREVAYWNGATPIGYIFSFGAVMGFVVGAIIVYQILFADVAEHLREYATLRAMGYSNRFVSGIVIQQAAILGLLGYIPGLIVVHFLYGKAAHATHMPLYITGERAGTVLAMTLAMCAISGLLAVRKVRRLDPADVF
jgi:putative ABC transport system permease protein